MDDATILLVVMAAIVGVPALATLGLLVSVIRGPKDPPATG